MPVFERDGRVIHYRVHKRSSEFPIVFINSLGTDMRVWDDLLGSMRFEGSAILSDKQGHGLSSFDAAEPSIERLAMDVLALLDHARITQAHICGLSIGGMIAQQIAIHHPERVGKLILMDTAHKISTPKTWQERINAVNAGGIESIADAVLQRWFAPSFRKLRRGELQLWRNMLVRTPVQGYISCSQAIAHADFTADVSRIHHDTMVVVGEHDGSTPPALADDLARMIPNSTLEIIEDAAHLPCVEKPKKTASLIDQFLAR